MLPASLELASPEGAVKETELILEAVQVGDSREDMGGCAGSGARTFMGGEEQAAVFLFWVHSRDSLCDLGPVTFPQHCCLSICEIKAPVSVTQALPGRVRLMRRSLQSV